MTRINEKLRSKCRGSPEVVQAVVITVGATVIGEKLVEIGLGDAEQIRGIPGLFKSRLTGARILELADHPDVEEITEDTEVGLF